MFDKADKTERFSRALHGLHDNLEAHGLAFAFGAAALHADAIPRLDRLTDRGAKLRPCAGRRHGQKVVRGMAGRDPQIALGRPGQVDDLVFRRNQGRGRGEIRQDLLPAQLRHGGLPQRRGRTRINRAVQRAVMPRKHHARISRTTATDLPVHPLGAADWLELILRPSRALRISKQQNPTRTKCEVEERNGFRLGFRVHIDQQVPARDHVEARKWGIGKKVVNREHRTRAQGRIDPETRLLLEEERRGARLGDAAER